MKKVKQNQLNVRHFIFCSPPCWLHASSYARRTTSSSINFGTFSWRNIILSCGIPCNYKSLALDRALITNAECKGKFLQMTVLYDFW